MVVDLEVFIYICCLAAERPPMAQSGTGTLDREGRSWLMHLDNFSLHGRVVVVVYIAGPFVRRKVGWSEDHPSPRILDGFAESILHCVCTCMRLGASPLPPTGQPMLGMCTWDR